MHSAGLAPKQLPLIPNQSETKAQLRKEEGEFH
jgi:hypothetical protein